MLFYKRVCSTSPPGGNQVDGSQPAPSTGASALWRRLASSKSVTWPSNGSDFSESDYYYSVGPIILRTNHVLEVSSLLLSLWETIVSEIDRRQQMKTFHIDF